MPEAGQTPQPAIKRGESLAYGEAAEVNDLVGLVPPPDEDGFQPRGEQEDFLFSPSDRPDEPFSAGMPFGAGPVATPQSYEDDDMLVRRVAADISSDPRAPKALKQFAARAREGL